MKHIDHIAWVVGLLTYIIIVTNLHAVEVLPLPPADLDPQWIQRLPPATFLLPKSAEYREIPQIPAATTELVPVMPVTPVTPINTVVPEIAAEIALPPSPLPLSRMERGVAEIALPPPEHHQVTIITPTQPAELEPTPKLISILPEPPPPLDTEIVQQVSADSSSTFWRVQIMEGRDQQQVRAYRRFFISQYRNLLHEHEPLISVDEVSGYFYLRLKPMPTEETAQKWCATLLARGGENCLVTKGVRRGSAPGWQIQLIAKTNFVGIKDYRRYLVSQYDDLFQDYKFIITLNESGEYFRLRLSYLPDELSARELCGTLKKQGLDCMVIKNMQVER